MDGNGYDLIQIIPDEVQATPTLSPPNPTTRSIQPYRVIGRSTAQEMLWQSPPQVF